MRLWASLTVVMCVTVCLYNRFTSSRSLASITLGLYYVDVSLASIAVVMCVTVGLYSVDVSLASLTVVLCVTVVYIV